MPLQPPPALRRILRNTGLLLGGQAVNGACTLAYTALAVRALGLEQFGILILVHAFAQAVGEVARFQSWQAVLRYATTPFQQGRTPPVQAVLRVSLRLDAGSALGGVLAGVALALVVGSLAGWPAALTPAAALYATSIAFMVPATPSGVLRLVNRFDLLASRIGLEAMFRLAGVALLWASGAGLMAFLALWYAATLFSFALLVHSTWAQLRRHGLARNLLRGEENAPRMPGIWRYLLAANINSTLSMAFTHGSTLLVGAFLGAADAGLYRIARQLANGITRPVSLMTPALYPELAALAGARHRPALRQLALWLTAIGGVAGSLLLLASLALAAPLLALVAGPGGVAAAAITTWLIAAEVISVWAIVLEPLLMTAGHAAAVATLRAAITLAYLPALALALQHHGLVGGGAVTLATMLLLKACQFFLLRRAHLLNRPVPDSPSAP